MAYRRVIPRDLFNEGSLLNLLGLLWLKLDDDRRHLANLEHVDDGPFVVDQDPADGSISTPNVRLIIDRRPVHLYRPLNARSPNPLWVRPNGDDEGDFDDTRVFTEDGALDPEFLALIRPALAGTPDSDEDEA